MGNDYYNSEVAPLYYEVAKNTNENFQLTDEFVIFSHYIQNGQKICEFGSWEGGKLKAFTGLNRNLSLYGIDISEMWIKAAKENSPAINYIVWDITKTSFPNNFFDITMSFFVYEHLENPLLAFQEMYRTTKNEWYIFLWFPNYGSPIFPSPPSIHGKSIFQKIWTIIKRLFWAKNVYTTVKPITDKHFQPDFDTRTEINMDKFIQHIKNNYKVTIKLADSKWGEIENGNMVFKFYYIFKLLNNSLCKYWWPQCFLIIEKQDTNN